MTRSGIAGRLLFLVVGCILGALVMGVGIAPANAATTHQLTVAGIDFRPLDNDVVTRFASGTGGGVWVSAEQRSPVYLEAPVDLPVGAQVTKVTYLYRNCVRLGDRLYFGAYAPSTGAYGAAIPEFAPPNSSCAATRAVTKTLSHPATVKGNQRWVLGDHIVDFYSAATYSPDTVFDLLVGAQITYLK